MFSVTDSTIYRGSQLSHQDQMLTANSNQITHGKFQIIDPARHLQSTTASGARCLKMFVLHEATTLGGWCHLVAFSSSSTNENLVGLPLQYTCSKKKTWFSLVELEEKATK